MGISTGNGLSSRERKLMNMDPFFGLDIELLQEIENRLKAELEDKEIPYQRKEEVESCLYYIEKAKRIKGGFYIDKKLAK